MNRWVMAAGISGLALTLTSCHRAAPEAARRASGYVEATEVKVASKVPGRIETVNVSEGQRLEAGAAVVSVATTDTDLALQRARAERDQAAAQLRLLEAGARPEDVRQAETQVAASMSEKRAIETELDAARVDEARYEQLLRARAGTEKQRDDAAARRAQAEARVKAAEDRTRVATAALERSKAGARPEEIAAARARVATADAQIATLDQNLKEAAIVAPSGGVVTSRLVEPGELVAAGVPLVVILDLDHAWVNAYVEENLVPGLRLDQAATVVSDAGDTLPGRITFISPRAEFTPRNVQTASERAKLIYRVKVTVDNRQGVLKPGMPVEITWMPAGSR
jgi:membrane fusion protein YbhG